MKILTFFDDSVRKLSESQAINVPVSKINVTREDGTVRRLYYRRPELLLGAEVHRLLQQHADRTDLGYGKERDPL